MAQLRSRAVLLSDWFFARADRLTCSHLPFYNGMLLLLSRGLLWAVDYIANVCLGGIRNRGDWIPSGMRSWADFGFPLLRRLGVIVAGSGVAARQYETYGYSETQSFVFWLNHSRAPRRRIQRHWNSLAR